jgi:hypothetical protein
MTSDWPKPSTARRQAEALHAAGMDVEIFAFQGGRNPLNYAVAWAQLRPRFNAHQYDVVHAHFAQSGLLALPKRVPLVVTFRSGDLGPAGPATRYSRLRRMLQLGAWLLARRADAVIVPSEEMRGRLRTRTPVHVIPPDTDEQALTARLLDVYRSVLPVSRGRPKSGA